MARSGREIVHLSREVWTEVALAPKLVSDAPLTAKLAQNGPTTVTVNCSPAVQPQQTIALKRILRRTVGVEGVPMSVIADVRGLRRVEVPSK